MGVSSRNKHLRCINKWFKRHYNGCIDFSPFSKGGQAVHHCTQYSLPQVLHLLQYSFKVNHQRFSPQKTLHFPPHTLHSQPHTLHCPQETIIYRPETLHFLPLTLHFPLRYCCNCHIWKPSTFRHTSYRIDTTPSPSHHRHPHSFLSFTSTQLSMQSWVKQKETRDVSGRIQVRNHAITRIHFVSTPPCPWLPAGCWRVSLPSSGASLLMQSRTKTLFENCRPFYHCTGLIR